MKSFVRTLALVALVVSLTGCLKVRQSVTVMPDGSGMVELSIGMSPQLIAMAQQQDQDPFEEFQPEAIDENMQGLVAYSEPAQEVEEDGYTYLTIRGYFTDVNEVAIAGMNDNGDVQTTFAYARDGDSATLTVTNCIVLAAASNYDPPKEEDVQMMRTMMAGLEFADRFTLPGNPAAIEGLEAEGNTVEMSVDLDDMIEGTGLLETFRNQESLTFEIAEVDVDDEAVEAFQAEMEAAIEAWENREEAEDDDK